MDIFRKAIRILMLACAVMHILSCQSKPIKALVVSGQNNHNWQVSHKVLKQILDNSGLFVTDIELTAPAGGDMSSFTPDFSQYDVVVLDYNGDRWPAETDSAFVQYVRKGGGVVIYHAADNALPVGKNSTVS